MQVTALVLSLAAVLGGRESRVAGPTPLGRDPQPVSRALHDVHLSHTRMVLEGTTVVCRIRLFKDDLEKALRQFSTKPDLAITESARADSIFGAYAGKTLILKADGKRVALKVSASGTEKDPSAQEIVWYVLEGESAAPPRKLGLLFGMMFEMFRDQQNLVQLLREPGGVRKTLYFASSEPTEQVVSF
jgi:hypothetical protein